MDKDNNNNNNNILSPDEIDKLLNEINSENENSSVESMKEEDIDKEYTGNVKENLIMWGNVGKTFTYDKELKEKCVTIPSRFSYTGDAFLDNEIIEEVIIEEGVKEISPYAFRGCTNLKKVTIPSSVTLIGSNAFAECTSLTEITLPDTITSIEQGAFYKSGLTEVKLPKNIDIINEGCFCGCSNLSKVTLPPFLLSINTSAFCSCVSLEEIKFPPSLSFISALSFSDCKSLRKVCIPKSVLGLNMLTFAGCTSLESIKIDCTSLTLNSDIFDGCENVKTFEISGDIKNLGILSDMKNLETVILNSSTIKIANGCFNNLSKLSVIVMNPLLLKEENQYSLENEVSDNHVCLGYGAFSGCSSLKMINQTFIDSPFYIYGSSLHSYLGKEENVVIPDNIKVIRGMSFKNNEYIKTVTIPHSVEVIEQEAFMGCKNLTKVIGGENVTRCEKDVFKNCPKVEGDLIEKDKNFLIFNHIATSLFYKIDDIFPKLKNVNIKTPDTIKSFAPSLFNFSDLESIEINEGVKEIKEGVFSSCSSLKRVILPESLETLSDDAFMGSLALEEVIVPDDLEIHKNTFLNEEQEVKVTRRKNYVVISNDQDTQGITEEEINEIFSHLKEGEKAIITVTKNNYKLRIFREQLGYQKDDMMNEALNNNSPFMSDKNSFVVICEDNYTEEKIKKLKKEDELYFRYDTIIPFVKEDKVIAYGEPIESNHSKNRIRITNIVEEQPFESNTFICYGTTNIDKINELNYLPLESVSDKNLYPLIYNKEVVAFGSLRDFKDEKKIKFTIEVILEKRINFLK